MTDKAKFAPGQIKYFDRISTAYECGCVCDCKGDVLATRLCDKHASAPALYAACERFLAQHQAEIDTSQSSAIRVQPFKRCDCGPCDEARAALKLARGEA